MICRGGCLRRRRRWWGFENRKGALAAGFDADVVVWNPAKSFRVEGEKLHHRHKLTPYEGRDTRRFG